jgi:hypothetical protein
MPSFHDLFVCSGAIDDIKSAFYWNEFRSKQDGLVAPTERLERHPTREKAS